MALHCDWCKKQMNSMTMLHIDLWAWVSEGRVNDVACCECIELKLGHKPTALERREPWWPEDVKP